MTLNQSCYEESRVILYKGEPIGLIGAQYKSDFDLNIYYATFPPKNLNLREIMSCVAWGYVYLLFESLYLVDMDLGLFLKYYPSKKNY